MVMRVASRARAGARASTAGRRERGGMIAPASRASPQARRTRTSRRMPRRVPTEPTTPTPGRSLVSRRAIVDIVRTATLGSYGVIGFAGGGPLGAPRRAARLSRRAGSSVRLGRGLAIELDLLVALRPADRGGRPPGRLGRPLRDPPGARARGRSPDDPRRRAARRARELRPHRTATGPAAIRATRPRRQRHGRRLMARRPCDGAGLLDGLPGGRRQPRGPRRRDQRASTSSRSPTATPARTCWRRSGPRSTRPRRRRAAGRADRGSHRLRCAHGRPRQLRASSPARSSAAWPRVLAARAVQRPRPGPRPVGGRADGIRRGRQAGRGHDPDGHPRVGGGSRRRRRARP